MSNKNKMEEKSCAARMEKTTGTFSFTVEGWSALPDKVGESTESPEFELCNKTWQLRIFPGGSLEIHANHISFYLASKSTALTRASYKLMILNQNSGGNDEVFASAGIRKFEAKGVQVDGWGRDKFIAASQLKDSWIGLCVNDTIVFKVEITVFGGLSPLSPPSSCISGAQILSLAQSLESAINNPVETFSDFIIRVDEEDIHVHKCLLSSRSEVFQAMLLSEMCEATTNVLNVVDVRLEVIKELIKFIYTDAISDFAVLDSMLIELYAASSKYAVNGLISICETRMLETINVNNCIDVYRTADIFYADKFKCQVMHYIVVNYMDVCNSEAYKHIVSNYDKDETCATLLDAMNVGVATCSGHRMHCMGLVSHMISSGSGDHNSSSPIDNSATAITPPGLSLISNGSHTGNHRIGRYSSNGCSVM